MAQGERATYGIYLMRAYEDLAALYAGYRLWDKSIKALTEGLTYYTPSDGVSVFMYRVKRADMLSELGYLYLVKGQKAQAIAHFEQAQAEVSRFITINQACKSAHEDAVEGLRRCNE